MFGTPICPKCSKAVYAAEQVFSCLFKENSFSDCLKFLGYGTRAEGMHALPHCFNSNISTVLQLYHKVRFICFIKVINTDLRDIAMSSLYAMQQTSRFLHASGA